MELRVHAVFLSLFVALGLCFSFSTESEAHDYKDYTHDSALDIDAREITDSGSEADIKKLLRHTAKHFELIENDPSLTDLVDKSRELSILSRKTRETGVFNNGSDIYLVRVTSRDAQTIISHGRHGGLYALEYDTTRAPLDELLADEVDADPVCATYGDDNKAACALKQTAVGLSLTYIVGFDHAQDSDYTKEPECSAITITPTARQVEEETNVTEKEDLLKQYVKAFRELIRREAITLGAELVTDNNFFDGTTLTPAGQLELAARLLEKVAPCVVREGAFKYGSIYLFVMDPVQGVSFLNGLDPALHGLSVSLEDPKPIGDESNVLVAFQEALTTGNTGTVPDDLADGNNAFVKYHWDDPTKDGDEVEDFLAKGQVPGTTVKESYLEVVDATSGIGPNRIFYVIGSGIYLDDYMPPGDGTMAAADDGCSIASTGSTHKSTLLNLLLAASVLFSAVFWRRQG